MTLVQVFLIHRYRAGSIHYLTPTEDNHRQSESLLKRGIFSYSIKYRSAFVSRRVRIA